MDDIRSVFIDIDGVLGDFEARYLEVVGIPFYSIHKSADRWDNLASKEKGFYYGIQAFKGAKDFVNSILLLDPIISVSILSALPSMRDFPTAYNEKIHWIRKHIHAHILVNIAESAILKQNYASPGDILIDDSPLNISQWVSAGGIGILHTSFEDSYNKLLDALTP